MPILNGPGFAVAVFWIVLAYPYPIWHLAEETDQTLPLSCGLSGLATASVRFSWQAECAVRFLDRKYRDCVYD